MKGVEYSYYKGCLKNDNRVREPFFKEYLPRIKGICRRYVVDKDEINDLVQESFIKIFTKIESFKWNGDGSFNSWVSRVTINIAIDYLKRQKKISMQPLDDDDIEEDVEPDNRESFVERFKEKITDDILLQALNSIPEHFKIVFNLSVIEGFSHKEIASQLGIPEKTSTTRLVRARKLLKEELITLFKVHA